MKNLLNFFFSFDKLFKEKLIVPFFWLALIVWGLGFFSNFLEKISLGPLAAIFSFFQAIISILFALVVIRIVSELAVAIFRINDNLSPDKGQSELVDIDPVLEARKAAELAAARTKEATRNVTEKAGEATKSLRENAAEMSETVQGKAKAATASVKEKADGLKSKTTQTKASEETPPLDVDPKPKPVEPAPKKRGRPVGSKNKTTSTKTSTPKTTSGAKRGPKPGTKIPRDKDGNLLKKDGTPRKKPGPKT